MKSYSARIPDEHINYLMKRYNKTKPAELIRGLIAVAYRNAQAKDGTNSAEHKVNSGPELRLAELFPGADMERLEAVLDDAGVTYSRGRLVRQLDHNLLVSIRARLNSEIG